MKKLNKKYRNDAAPFITTVIFSCENITQLCNAENLLNNSWMKNYISYDEFKSLNLIITKMYYRFNVYYDSDEPEGGLNAS